jgi:hypothetical protein
VILRRGPSKWVEIVSWDTQRDAFEHGAWFHGRIYQRRSDLSPDGTKLVYFANKFSSKTISDKEYTYAWTAVSKVPYLTALALWPKGDCWWGGGLFKDNGTVLLNHRPSEATPHPRHVPNRLRVIPNPDAHGEDDPLYSERLTRDGWVVRQEWRWEQIGWDGFRTDVPELRSRRHSNNRLELILERRLDGLRYRELFQVEVPSGQTPVDLARADWADWDHTGRLIVLRAGKVFAAVVKDSAIGELSELIDLTADRPTPRATPHWAETW